MNTTTQWRRGTPMIGIGGKPRAARICSPDIRASVNTNTRKGSSGVNQAGAGPDQPTACAVFQAKEATTITVNGNTVQKAKGMLFKRAITAGSSQQPPHKFLCEIGSTRFCVFQSEGQNALAGSLSLTGANVERGHSRTCTYTNRSVCRCQMNTAPPPPDARQKLLDAAVALVRRHGFAATSVDALCREAGVTKGAFFHHFPSKEALGVAAAQHWTATTSALFASAAYHTPEDPLDRVLAYIDFRGALIADRMAPEFTCLVGTMVQETYANSEAIRAVCRASIFGHADTLVADIDAAIVRHQIKANWTAESLAQHTQAVLQGAFILAKADGGPGVAHESVAHLRRYVELLFSGSTMESLT